MYPKIWKKVGEGGGVGERNWNGRCHQVWKHPFLTPAISDFSNFLICRFEIKVSVFIIIDVWGGWGGCGVRCGHFQLLSSD